MRPRQNGHHIADDMCCYSIQSYVSNEPIRADATGFYFPIEQKQNDHHLAYDIFKFTSMYDICFILIKIPLEFLPKGPSKGMSGLV